MHLCEQVTSQVVVRSFFSEDFPDKIPGTETQFVTEIVDTIRESYNSIQSNKFLLAKLLLFKDQSLIYERLLSSREKALIRRVQVLR